MRARARTSTTASCAPVHTRMTCMAMRVCMPVHPLTCALHVRAGGLKLGPPSGIVNVIDGEAGAINRADVAAFCLDAVMEPDFPWLGQAVCISSDQGAGFKSLLGDKSMSRMGGERRRQKYD